MSDKKSPPTKDNATNRNYRQDRNYFINCWNYIKKMAIKQLTFKNTSIQSFYFYKRQTVILIWLHIANLLLYVKIATILCLSNIYLSRKIRVITLRLLEFVTIHTFIGNKPILISIHKLERTGIYHQFNTLN